MIRRATDSLVLALVLLIITVQSGAQQGSRITDVQFLSENLIAGNLVDEDGRGSVFAYDISEETLDLYPFPENKTAILVHGSSEQFAAWVSTNKQRETRTTDYWFSQGSLASIARATQLRDINPHWKTLVVSLLPERGYLEATHNKTGGYDYRLFGRDQIPLTETMATHSGDDTAYFFPKTCAAINTDDREFLVIVERVMGEDLCNIRLCSLPSLREVDRQTIAGFPLQIVRSNGSSTLFLLLRGQKSLISIAIRKHHNDTQLDMETWIHELPFGDNAARQLSAKLFVVETDAPGELFAFPMETPLKEDDVIEGSTWSCFPKTDSGTFQLSPGGSRLVGWDNSKSTLEIFDIQYPSCEPLAEVVIKGVNVGK